MALNLIAKVHPVVFFTIVDAYERRHPEAHRVIGTLLGEFDHGINKVTKFYCYFFVHFQCIRFIFGLQIIEYHSITVW